MPSARGDESVPHSWTDSMELLESGTVSTEDDAARNTRVFEIVDLQPSGETPS
ncbi:MAG TPA: hypothetical protein VJ837_03515 [Candidatus Paceibacterota bacterium]|nr:hypothetical protein [Candidatus Paceibacterota bacterium]